ncbi:MAG TPA: cupin domain-containing protein, partial [Novosphingobium sp.]|nr:cupin domain-containing protein [Novosphingobium sp.]
MNAPALPTSHLLRLASNSGQDAELFEDVLRRPGLRIERIVSRGQTTPPDQPYVQGSDEWVLVLTGQAELWLEGTGHRRLETGDGLLIPAGVAHR